MTPCQCLTTHLLTYLKGFCRGHGHGARRAAALRRRRARRRPARQGRRRASAQAGLRGGRPGSARPIYRVLRPAAGGGRWRQVAGEIWYFWVGILGCGTHLVYIWCCRVASAVNHVVAREKNSRAVSSAGNERLPFENADPVQRDPHSLVWSEFNNFNPLGVELGVTELFWYGVPQGRWLPSPRP